MKKIILLIITAFFLCNCTNPYIGKQVPWGSNVEWFHGKTGHHTFEMKHLIFNYDYTIDADTIALKGSVSCGAGARDWDQADIRVSYILLDKERYITDHKSMFLGDFYDDISFCEERNLETSIPKYPGLQGITWGYDVKIRGY